MTRPVYELKADFFKTLGHPVRIRILEVLQQVGECGVTDISDAVGVGGSTLSQHLATLRRADVVSSRREGSQVLYQVVDTRVFKLLQIGRQILTTSLEGSQDVLADLEQLTVDHEPGGRRRR
jgi:ArsR family transcriptional regulator